MIYKQYISALAACILVISTIHSASAMLEIKFDGSDVTVNGHNINDRKIHKATNSYVALGLGAGVLASLIGVVVHKTGAKHPGFVGAGVGLSAMISALPEQHNIIKCLNKQGDLYAEQRNILEKKRPMIFNPLKYRKAMKALNHECESIYREIVVLDNQIKEIRNTNVDNRFYGGAAITILSLLSLLY